MDSARLLTRGQMTYAEGSPPGAYDPSARLRVMDAEGIDAVLLYPTIGICWEGHVADRRLSTSLHARVQPVARGVLPHGPPAPLPRGAHLPPRPRGRGGGDPPRPQGWLCRDLSVPGSRGPGWAALRRPSLRWLLGDGPGPGDADRLPRRRARPPVVPAVAAPGPIRQPLRLRVPGHRRHGRLHPDAVLRDVRALPAPPVRGAGGRIQLDRGLAGSARPQVPRHGAPDPDSHGAQRVLLPAMSRSRPIRTSRSPPRWWITSAPTTSSGPRITRTSTPRSAWCASSGSGSGRCRRKAGARSWATRTRTRELIRSG